MKLLRIYLKQRFHPLLWLALTVYLVLMSVPISAMSLETLIVFLGLFWQLLLLRLYDDLMQVKHDAGKANRAYTQRESRFTLIIYLLIFLIASFGVMAKFSPELTYTFISFWLINHVLYLLYIRNPVLAQLLPLFKYPILSCLVLRNFSGQHAVSVYSIVLIAIIVWGSILVFEMMDDPFFFVSKRYVLPFQVLTFLCIVLLDPLSIQNTAALALMFVSLIFTHRKTFGYAYIYFACLALAKLSVF